MPLQHQRIYIIRRIFQTVLVQHPRAFCQAHTCQTVILRHNQVPGLTRLTSAKSTLSAPLSNTSVCAPSRSIRWDVSHRITTGTPFFPCAPQGQIDSPGSRLHRSKLSCAYSPSLIVLCFGLIIVPCSRCAFQHARGTHSRRTAKAWEAFRRPPEKPPVPYYSKSAALFLQFGLHLGQRLFFQIVEKFGTDELQHLPHPLGKLHRSFPESADLPRQCILPEKPVLSIQMLEDRYALENHLLDAVHHGDAELAMQALQSFRGVTIPGRKGSYQDHHHPFPRRCPECPATQGGRAGRGARLLP